ncbi:hypothetical protein POL68_19345 [Stigmatella sp. ncwal1]|uniref:Uncharacterized protein n=1 Tax=Stigmatella ashevillensis TaxID=2995309 RepID=A0ABT5DAD1_9BACT|nr:hypothetical protein [Stigmatella ashevillena]MDC0710640.1 hypothetical protein [Stigmatella ashevillena]
MFRKFPTKPIDEKKKTGDLEQLGIIWAAYQAVLEESGDWTPEARKKFSRDYEGLLKSELASPDSLNDPFSRASKYNYNPAWVSNLEQSVPFVMEVRAMLSKVFGKLGPGYRQFVVNLALFDFRTAGGGRARKSTQVLRSGAGVYEYARPFAGPLPYAASAWLSVVPKSDAIDAKPSDPEVIKLPFKVSGMYVPPTRFTATFPLTLARTPPTDDKKTLVNPHVTGKPFPVSAPIKYAYLGSFGFAEPGYSEWGEGDGEYPGTRLSLGAYSLHPTYLAHLKFVMDAMDEGAIEGYKKYGGVGEKHVGALKDRLGEKGLKLACDWVRELADIACALVTRARENSKPELAAFFQFIEEKIQGRVTKLLELEKVVANPEAFEYVWVFESTLWEFAFLGASCLSADEIREALGRLMSLKSWQPSVGFSRGHEHDVRDMVLLGDTAFAFERIYFPSGTSAATVLHELLVERGFKPHPYKLDRSKLSTFTPYFEFYLEEDAFLNEKQVSSLSGDLPKVQLWLNLSDGLHSEFMGLSAEDAGLKLATLMRECIEACVPNQSVCLVIDYTKITGDMPNSKLYPLLAVMAGALKAHVEKLRRVILLRSNLKYNTGSLDRYQSGEILVPWKSGSQKPSSDLAARLSARAVEVFAGREVNDISQGVLPKDWELRGEYVPLMKKLYLLSDAITSGRWKKYAKLWK